MQSPRGEISVSDSTAGEQVHRPGDVMRERIATDTMRKFTNLPGIRESVSQVLVDNEHYRDAVLTPILQVTLADD